MLLNQRGQRGDTTITVLLAATVIAVVAVSAGAIVKFSRTQSAFSRTTSSALAVESYLLSAIQRSETYASVADQMAQGTPPATLQFMMDHNGTPTLAASVAGPVKLTEDGTPCAAAPCAITTHVAYTCQAALCRAAYRVEFDPTIVKTQLPALGATSWPPQAADYTQIVSPDIYRRQGVRLKCDGGDLFVTGMNRSTGEVICVHPTTRQIAANEIGKSMTYDAGTRSLEVKTLPLHKGVCPPKYVGQSFAPTSLESSPVGTCVYRYKKEVPWMKAWPASSESVSDRFCPVEDYEAVGDGACVVRIVSQTPGRCPQTCSDADGHSYDCSYTVAPDTSYTVSQSVSGPNASCSLTKTGTQHCGSSWVGAVSWSGKCKLTLPETQPMGGD